MNSQHADLMKQINETGDWNGDIESKFKAALEDFRKNHAY